jgi:hypothetical protein
MWEFANDLTQPLPVDACQVSSCDNTTLSALIEALRGLPRGPGFAKKLDKIVDWKMFHQFQCISWMLATPDDPIHAGNNLVIAERDSDHKLVWLPYSVDISSQTDVPDQRVPLTGSTVLPRGCQSDPDCWKDTLATCDDLIGKLEQVNPRKMLSDTVAQLEALGMLRDGDQERAEQLDHWYEQQQASLRSELEYFSHIPDVTGACPENTVRCQDGACAKQATCDARSCPTDKPWCPSRGACVSRKYDTCPTCPKAKPFYCGVTKACVLDDVTCNDECLTTAGPGFSYCALFGTCVQDGACFDDGGGGGPIID